jgi:hypothetical protein
MAAAVAATRCDAGAAAGVPAETSRSVVAGAASGAHSTPHREQESAALASGA